MKNLCLLIISALLLIGCSKSEEPSRSEQLGEELATQLKAPIEKARAASEKASATRDIELPK